MNCDFGRRLIDYLAIVGVRKPNGNSKQIPLLLHRSVFGLVIIDKYDGAANCLTFFGALVMIVHCTAFLLSLLYLHLLYVACLNQGKKKLDFNSKLCL